jgi:hypothetical protein
VDLGDLRSPVTRRASTGRCPGRTTQNLSRRAADPLIRRCRLPGSAIALWRTKTDEAVALARPDRGPSLGIFKCDIGSQYTQGTMKTAVPSVNTSSATRDTAILTHYHLSRRGPDRTQNPRIRITGPGCALGPVAPLSHRRRAARHSTPSITFPTSCFRILRPNLGRLRNASVCKPIGWNRNKGSAQGERPKNREPPSRRFRSGRAMWYKKKGENAPPRHIRAVGRWLVPLENIKLKGPGSPGWRSIHIDRLGAHLTLDATTNRGACGKTVSLPLAQSGVALVEMNRLLTRFDAFRWLGDIWPFTLNGSPSSQSDGGVKWTHGMRNGHNA